MIDEYLGQLKAELIKEGADQALVQDAVYDADEYLRGEMSTVEDSKVHDNFEYAIQGHGSPEEVANFYLEAELIAHQATRVPIHRQSQSTAGRFFGVLIDPRAYGSLLYMFLSLATGIVYFTLAVGGAIFSLSMLILIIGIPLALLFLSLVRGVAIIEGRLIEALLGVRMPRHHRPIKRKGGLFEHIKSWFTDRRTWTTLLYMFLQLPLGVVYFIGTVTGVTVCLSMIGAPAIQLLFALPIIRSERDIYMLEPWSMPFIMVAGVLLLVVLMHVVRDVGNLHGSYAKVMLVGGAEDKRPVLHQ